MTIERKHHLKRSGRVGLIFAVIGGLCLSVIFAASGPVSASEEAPIFSFGDGPYELIIFTDYFCQPCQRIEGGLDKTLDEIIARGGVKVTLVDLPLYKMTPLYARYFLYALNASSGYKDALRARQLLFKKASSFGAVTAEHLERDFKSEGIAFKSYDVKPSLARYSELIARHKVRSTPTFVFVYSSTDIRKYSGSEPIRKGLDEFLKAIKPSE